jgi:hypothetical protein
MRLKKLVGMLAMAMALATAVTQWGLHQEVAAQSGQQVPLFQVDPSWPALPNNWGLGVTSSVAVDGKDHVWILHRPRTGVKPGKTPAPPVLEFDQNGKFVQGWGGDAPGVEWPSVEHGIYVDPENGVWIGGSARTGGPTCADPPCKANQNDDMLSKFTAQGKFLMSIGKRNASTGGLDTRNVHAVTDVYVYRGELYASDGYEGPGPQGNCRVIVFDAATGVFKRFWGGFGMVPPRCRPQAPAAEGGGGRGGGRGAAPAAGGAPPAPRPQPAELGTAHGIEISKDGLVYVADRGNGRVQVFTPDGKFVNQVMTNGPAAVAFSPDAEQRFMYVPDQTNGRIVVIDRKKLEILYQFGGKSDKPGDFQAPHNAATDSKGNLYTAEVDPGNRAQRFVYKGLGPIPTNTN